MADFGRVIEPVSEEAWRALPRGPRRGRATLTLGGLAPGPAAEAGDVDAVGGVAMQ